jgi:hypothetical protein
MLKPRILVTGAREHVIEPPTKRFAEPRETFA